MPTFTPSAPASINAFAPSASRDVSGDDLSVVTETFDSGERVDHASAVSVQYENDAGTASLQESLGAHQAVVADANRCGNTQPTLLILTSVRKTLRLLDVLDRNEPTQPAIVVDDEELFNTMFVQQVSRFFTADPVAHRYQSAPCH